VATGTPLLFKKKIQTRIIKNPRSTVLLARNCRILIGRKEVWRPLVFEEAASQPGTRVASRTAYSQAKESSRLSDIFALCLLTFTSACCQIGTGAVNLERSS
jgi:hypothetical protein